MSEGPRLSRTLGTGGAVLLGLGSILGTGVFVSLGLAAGVAGSAVLPAIVLAFGLATANGLSSAQLAARHPVAGGTYEHGNLRLGPLPGFVAGWTFLAAKSASAATAALGCAGYALALSGLSLPRVPVALGVVALVLAFVVAGLRRSSTLNAVLVALTVFALATFVVAALLRVAVDGGAADAAPVLPLSGAGWKDLLHATALAFVAFTGYARVATLAEEVEQPERTIPRAVIATLGVSVLLYLAVATAALALAGPDAFASAARADAAPLAVLLDRAGGGSAVIVAVVSAGAITAMAGVLLNLLLGLSRVALAMARRADLPRGLAHVSTRADGETTPTRAVLCVAGLVGAITLVGDVGLTWSFSAFAVLVYYGLTNLAALTMTADERTIGRWVPAAGLLGCLGLALFLDARTLVAGGALLAAGVAWHLVARRLGRGAGADGA